MGIPCSHYHVTVTGDNPLPVISNGSALAAEMLNFLWSKNERVAPQSLALAARRSWSAWEFIGLPHSARETLKDFASKVVVARSQDDAHVIRAVAHFHRAVEALIVHEKGTVKPMLFEQYIDHYSLDQACSHPWNMATAQRYVTSRALSPQRERLVFDTFLRRADTGGRFGETYEPMALVA